MQRVEDSYVAAHMHRAAYCGFPIQASFMVPRGQIFMVYGVTTMHPSEWMKVKNNFRTPLWTRHMPGVRELERDRRRHPQ